MNPYELVHIIKNLFCSTSKIFIIKKFFLIIKLKNAFNLLNFSIITTFLIIHGRVFFFFFLKMLLILYII